LRVEKVVQFFGSELGTQGRVPEHLNEPLIEQHVLSSDRRNVHIKIQEKRTLIFVGIRIYLDARRRSTGCVEIIIFTRKIGRPEVLKRRRWAFFIKIFE
jgi:hypothetical protein